MQSIHDVLRLLVRAASIPEADFHRALEIIDQHDPAAKEAARLAQVTLSDAEAQELARLQDKAARAAAEAAAPDPNYAPGPGPANPVAGAGFNQAPPAA